MGRRSRRHSSFGSLIQPSIGMPFAGFEMISASFEDELEMGVKDLG